MTKWIRYRSLFGMNRQMLFEAAKIREQQCNTSIAQREAGKYEKADLLPGLMMDRWFYL